MARHTLLLAYLLVSTLQSIFANVPSERPRPEQEPSLKPGESGGGRFTTIRNENNEPCCPGHSFIPHRNHDLNFKNSYDTRDNQPSNGGENKKEDHIPESFSPSHSQPIERHLPKEPNNGLENYPNSPQVHSAGPYPGFYNVAPEDNDIKDTRPTDDRSGSGRSALTNNPIQQPGNFPKSDIPDSRTGQNDSPLNAEKPSSPGRFDHEPRDNNGLEHTEMKTDTKPDQNGIPNNKNDQQVDHDGTGLEKNNNQIVPEIRPAQQGNSYVPNRVCQHCFTPKHSEFTGPTNHSPRSGGNSLPPGEMRSSDNVNNHVPNNPRDFFPNYNFRSHPSNDGSKNFAPNRNNYDYVRPWRNGSHLADGRSGYDRPPENLDNRDNNLVSSYNRGNGRSSQGENNGTPYTWTDRRSGHGGNSHGQDFWGYGNNGRQDGRLGHRHGQNHRGAHQDEHTRGNVQSDDHGNGRSGQTGNNNSGHNSRGIDHDGGHGHGRSWQGEPIREGHEHGGNTHRGQQANENSHRPNSQGERNPVGQYNNRGSGQNGGLGNERSWQGEYGPHDHHGNKNGTNSLGERNQEGQHHRSGGQNGGVGHGRSSQGVPPHGDPEIGGNSHREHHPDGYSHRPNTHGERNTVWHYNRGRGPNGGLGNERSWEGRNGPHDHHGNKHNNIDERNQEGQHHRSSGHNGGVGHGRSSQGEPTHGDPEEGRNTHRDHHLDGYRHSPNSHGERDPVWHYNRGRGPNGRLGNERSWQGGYGPHDHHGNKNGTNSLDERNQEGQDHGSGGHNGGVGRGRSSQGETTHGDPEVGGNTHRDQHPDWYSHRSNSHGERNPVWHYNRGRGPNGRLGNERSWQGGYRPHDHHGNKNGTNSLDERNQEGIDHGSGGHNGGVGHGRSSQGEPTHGDPEVGGNTHRDQHPDWYSHRPNSHGKRNPVWHYNRGRGPNGRLGNERSWQGGYGPRDYHENRNGTNSLGERKQEGQDHGSGDHNGGVGHGRSSQGEPTHGDSEVGGNTHRDQHPDWYSHRPNSHGERNPVWHYNRGRGPNGGLGNERSWQGGYGPRDYHENRNGTNSLGERKQEGQDHGSGDHNGGVGHGRSSQGEPTHGDSEIGGNTHRDHHPDGYSHRPNSHGKRNPVWQYNRGRGPNGRLGNERSWQGGYGPHDHHGNKNGTNSLGERKQEGQDHGSGDHNGGVGHGRSSQGEPTHGDSEIGGNTHRDQHPDWYSHRPNSHGKRNPVWHYNRGRGPNGRLGNERSWQGGYGPRDYHENRNGTNSLGERKQEGQDHGSGDHNGGVGHGRSSQGEPTHGDSEVGGNTHRDQHPDWYSHRPNSHGERNPVWHYNRGRGPNGGLGNERSWQGGYGPRDYHENRNGTNSLGERKQEGQDHGSGDHNGGVGHGRSSQGEPTHGDSEIGGNTHRDHHPDGYSHRPNSHGERNPVRQYNRGRGPNGRLGNERSWQGGYGPHDHHGNKNGTNSLDERNQEGQDRGSGGRNGGFGHGRSSQGEPTHGDPDVDGNTHRDHHPDGYSHRPNNHGERNPVWQYNRGRGPNGRLGNGRSWQGGYGPRNYQGNKHNNFDERNQEGQHHKSGGHNGGVGHGRSSQGEPTHGDSEIGGNTHRDHHPDGYSHRPNSHGERNPVWQYNRGRGPNGRLGNERSWQGGYGPHDHHGNKNGTNSLDERNQEGQDRGSGGRNGGFGHGRSSQGEPTHGDPDVDGNTHRDHHPDGYSHRPNNHGERNPVWQYNLGRGPNGRLGNGRSWQGGYGPRDYQGNKHNNFDERNQEGQHHKSGGHNGGVGHGRSSQGEPTHGVSEIGGNTHRDHHPNWYSHRPNSHGERNQLGQGVHHRRENGHGGRGHGGVRSWDGGPTRWGHQHDRNTHGINSHGERNLERRQPESNIPSSYNGHGRSGPEENRRGQNEYGLEEEKNRQLGGYREVNGQGNNGDINWMPHTSNHLGNANYCCMNRKNQQSHNPRENEQGHTGINHRGNSQGETEPEGNRNEETNLNDRGEFVKSNSPQSDDNNRSSNSHRAPENKMSGEENGSKVDVEPEAPKVKENNQDKSPPRRPFHRVVEDETKPGIHGKGRSGQGRSGQAEDVPEESHHEENSFDENNEIETTQNDQQKINYEAHSNEVTPDYRNYDYGSNYGRIYNRNGGNNHGNGSYGQWSRQNLPRNFRHSCPHC